MVSIEISPNNPLLATLITSGEKRNFGIRNYHELIGTSKEVENLLRTTIVAHLVAPDFPEEIETNFPLDNSEVINELYLYYDKKIPAIKALNDQINFSDVKNYEKENEVSCVNAHSGGLDSAYRLTKCITDGEKVLALHLRNLNPKSGYWEASASKIQAEVWGVPYKELHLINSSKNFGYNSMKTRDLFVGVATAAMGVKHGAKYAVIEGDFITDKYSGNFSEYQKTWEMFNRILSDKNQTIQIKGMDAGDIESVGEVIKLEEKLNKPIISLVQNCFSAKFQLPGNRRKWERETPEISTNSSGNWCGSCIKCRRITLGRLYYHDPSFKNVGKNETSYFINDTYRWIKNYEKHHDLISNSFMSHLEKLESVR